jgi:hypothetical protein
LIKKREGKHWGFKPTPRLKRLFKSVPVVEEQIDQIERLSAQSSNILYLNTTRDSEVRDKSSSSGVVANETPSKSSPPPRVSSANSSEGTVATPGSSVHTLRARVVGKPVLGATNSLGPSTVPVPPFYSKRTVAKPAPFSSVAAKQPDEKRLRPTPAFRGQPGKVLPRPEPPKLSVKPSKLGNRKVQKKAKRPSGDDLSEWW